MATVVLEVSDNGAVVGADGAEAWLYRVVDGVASINVRVQLPEEP